MKEILTNLKIPTTIEVDGKITVQNATLTFDKEISEQIDSAILRIYIESKTTVNGIQIDFSSRISHTLTKEELDNLMIKFNK